MQLPTVHSGTESGAGKKPQNKSQGWWVILDMILSYFHSFIYLLLFVGKAP